MSVESKSTSLPAALGFSLASLLLVTVMALGSLVLWIVVPIAWLWVGSQIENETQSLGLALAAIAVGVAVSIALVVKVLRWMNSKHLRIRQERGRDVSGLTALEIIMVASGVVAVAGFFVWFVAFSGTSPLPLNVTY